MVPAIFRKKSALLTLCMLAAFAVYLNTLDAGFVYDDNSQILENPWVQELRFLPRVVTNPVWAFKMTVPTNYFRPVQMGAYNLLWVAFGGHPLPFHLTNVLLHTLTTGGLVLLVLRLSREPAVAAGAGLLFAVHPVNTEAVAWIACLPELSYSALSIAVLLLHIAAWDASARRALRLKAAAFGVFTVALFAKETAVVVALLAFLLEIRLRPRLESTAGGPARILQALGACAGYAAAVGLYVVARLAAVGGMAPLERGDLTAWDAVLNAPSLILAYAMAMVLPLGLLAYHVFEPIRTIAEPAFWGALVATGLLVAGAIYLQRRRADLGLAAALVFLPLLPVLYVPAIGDNAFAERYTYLPVAGMVWLGAAALESATRRIGTARARAAALTLFALVFLAGAVGTLQRNRVWHDDERLATATLRDEPLARPMWFILANWYKKDERPERAIEVYDKALEHFPGHRWLRAERINAEYALHRISAETAVERLRSLQDPALPQHWLQVYLGNALRQSGDDPAAERAYRRAIELNPSYRPAYFGLRLALIGQGRSDPQLEAMAHGAGMTRRDSADLLLEAAAYLTAGRLERAEALFQRVLEDDPESHSALLSLALVEVERPDLTAALDYCKRAIEAEPDYVDAYQQLGVIAMRMGDLAAAVDALEQARALDPHNKEVYNRLGVAYVRSGRPADARAAWLRALEIDPDHEESRRNLERLERQSGRP